MANDADYVRAVLASGTQLKSSGNPGLSVWTIEAALLARNNDLQQQNNLLLQKINSKQGAQMPEFRPEPRPLTAFDAVRQERKIKTYNDLTSKLLGSRAGKQPSA